MNRNEWDYGRADLRRTRFDFCTFEDADFGGSLMADTSFVGAKGTAQSSMPFLTDLETMRRSGWQRRSVSRTEVVGFQWKDHAGVVAATLEGGLDAESWVTVSDEFHGTGLQILFHTLLLPLDRFLIDGVIFGLLGTETDCHIVELQERGSTTLVRLDSTNVEHLVIVAEALHERIWEAQERAQHVALLRLASVLQLSTMAAALTALVGKIDRMELRGDSDAVKAAVLEVLGDDAIEMLHDQGEKHVLAKWDNKLSTPTQKISRALGKMLVKKVAGEVGGVIEGEVKDAVKKLGDGEGSMD